MKNIYKIIIALIILVPTVAFGAILPTTVNQGNGFINPLRIGDRIEAAYFIASSSVTKSTFPYASSTVISATGICISTDCRTVWPTGGGGSGGGTWSTTTSTVAGRLINYPNNTTDIPTIGATATSTADYWFDPNTNIAYLGGNVGVGTTSPRFPLQIAATTTPQLVLTSNGITETDWAFRNAGGNMYIQGSNPVTFATTSSPTLSLSSTLNQVAVGTSTFAAGVQLTIGAGANPVVAMFDSISATGMYTIYRNSNIDFGYIGSAGVLFSGSGGVKTDLAIRASQNLTFGSGSGEDMRISTTGFVGIATSSPYAPLSVVGFGGIVTPNITATSTTATSTFAGGVDLRNATVQQKGDFIIPFATSTATTTKQFYNVTTLETWTSAACKTASGTANIVFSDGTNSTNMIPASSTYATYNFTQNNRFVPGMTVQYSVGTPVSLTDVFCTVNYISNI